MTAALTGFAAALLLAAALFPGRVQNPLSTGSVVFVGLVVYLFMIRTARHMPDPFLPDAGVLRDGRVLRGAAD